MVGRTAFTDDGGVTFTGDGEHSVRSGVVSHVKLDLQGKTCNYEGMPGIPSFPALELPFAPESRASWFLYKP